MLAMIWLSIGAIVTDLGATGQRTRGRRLP
jgi:hypothetical protein